MKKIYNKIFAFKAFMLFAILTSAFTSNAQVWTIGTGSAGSNAFYEYPTPYGQWYTMGKTQFMYTAAELSAQGMTVGNINQLAFNVTSAYFGQPISGFTISMANTLSPDLAGGWEGGLTNVLGPIAYTPSLGWNTHNIAAFNWDGFSNVVINICWEQGGCYDYSENGQTAFSNTPGIFALYFVDDCTPNPCSNWWYTNTDTRRPDIRFTRLSNCVGTPAAGVASGPANACPSTPFTISTTGLTIGSGITYQWFQNGIAMGGQNGSTLTTTQGAASTYYCTTICSFSGGTNQTNTVSIGLNSFLNCYCTPSSQIPCYGYDDITHVGLNTINNNSTCTSGYSDYFSTVSTTLGLGTSYAISMTSDQEYFGADQAVAWIDYDHSGTFDAGEISYLTGSGGVYGQLNWDGTIAVPGGALTGITRMRCALHSTYFEPADPCASVLIGEYEDYQINIIFIPNCTGTPATGGSTIMTAGTMPVCAGTSFTLETSTALTSGPGISYQWEYNSGSGWFSLSGGGITASSPTSPTTSITGQSVATQYRLKTICSFSGGTNSSTPISVTQDVASNCYCTPTYSIGNIGGGGDFLNSISLNGFSNVTGPNAPSPDYYLYTSAPLMTTLDKGSFYTANVGVGPSWGEYIKIWIDYNHDGVFDNTMTGGPTSEYVGDVYCPAGTIQPINFSVPTAAYVLTGNTRIRFRCTYGIGTGLFHDPCLQYTFGETEDYVVNIQSLPDCAGLPLGGTTNSSDPSPCSGIPFSLSTSGGTTGVGALLYQWQIATSCAGPWNDIALATASITNYTFSSATTKAFRRRIVCSVTNDTAYSSCLSLTSTLCYCAPSHTTGTSTGFYINRFEIENAGLNNLSGASASAPFYTDYTISVPAANMMQSAPYWINTTTGSNLNSHDVGIWIDYNQDGDFMDASEYIGGGSYLVPGGGFVWHVLANVPATAVLGTTRCRVRASGNSFSYLDPCLSTNPDYQYGESEDYAVQIVANACVNPTVAGFVTGISPSLTVANDFISVAQSGAQGTLTAWQIDWTAPYNFTPSDASLTSYSGDFIANVNPPNGFVYIRAQYQNGGCPVAFSNPALVKLDCASSCSVNTADNDYIANVSLGAGGSIINHNSTFDPTYDGYQNFLNLGPYHVTRTTAYPFQVSVTSFWSEGVRVWIDENGDGTFQNTESVYSDAASSGAHALGSITIPCGSGYVGEVKMRVVCRYNTTPDVDACYGPVANAYGYGEIEEYTLYLDPIQDITVSPQAAVCIGQTAVLSGTGPVGTTNFKWTPTNGVNGVIMNPAGGVAATVTVSTTSPSNVFFTVTGTLANGCTSYNIVPVATTPLAGTVTPIGSIICSGGTKLLSATGAAGVYQWQWSLDNVTWNPAPGVNTNGLSYTTPPTALLYYYRLLSKSTICYDISSNTALVEIASTPIVTFTNVTATAATVNWSPAGGGSYNIAWTGAGTGSLANATPPLVLTGLTPNTNLSVTVTLTNPPACAGVSAGTGTTKTLCAAPVAPTFGTITATSAVVNIPAGTTSYTVYYKLLQISNSYTASGCLAGGSAYTITSNTYPGAAVSVYLQACNCPSVGQYGQAGPSVVQYLLPGTSTCPTPTPFTTNEVTSSCPNRITVALGGNPSNTYRVTFRRVLPTVSAPTTYNVTGTSMNYTVLNTPLPQVWEVYAVSTCGPSYGIPYSIMTQVVNVQVKGGCNKIQNLVLSHATCHGLTATWNVGDCGIPSTNLLGYTVFVKPGASQWSGYPSLTNVKSANIFATGTLIQVYVRANSCNGSFGPASDIQTITTLSVGCRQEDQQTEESLNNTGITTENGTLSLFPNPNAGEFNIDLQMGDVSTQDVRIEVMNMLGQTVQTQITSISGGHLTENVGMPSGITSGNYMVRVMVGEKTTFTSRVNISK